jgi:hypothetical protein
VLRGGRIAARETVEVARAVTYSIRHGAGPLRNVEIGQRHIHH